MEYVVCRGGAFARGMGNSLYPQRWAGGTKWQKSNGKVLRNGVYQIDNGFPDTERSQR